MGIYPYTPSCPISLSSSLILTFKQKWMNPRRIENYSISTALMSGVKITIIIYFSSKKKTNQEALVTDGVKFVT